MRRIAILLLLAAVGCRGGGPFVGGMSWLSTSPGGWSADAAESFPASLPELWRAAEASHPELLSAQIDLQAKQREAAIAKHTLETELACAQQYAAALALAQKRFELMHRIRGGFYQYAASADSIAAYDRAVKRLEEDVRQMRAAVDDSKTQPRSNLIALEVLLEQSKAARAKAQLERAALWRRLAIEAGLSPDVEPATAAVLPGDPPTWDFEQVQQRVLSENVRLQQAIQAERVAALNWERLSRTAWGRRKQAQVIEAEAAVGKAQTLIAQTARTLMQETDAAMTRFETAQSEWRMLHDVILPQRQEQLRLVARQYEIGAVGGSLPELLAARQALNEVELQIAQARVQLWQAIAEIEALLQVEIGFTAEEIPPLPPWERR